MILRVALALALAAAQPVQAAEFMAREYQVFDGRAGRSSPGPVALVLHGAGGTGAQVRRNTGFDEVARAHGLVAVYPDGPGRRWNDGRGFGEADDSGYLRALVRDLAERGLADPARIYVLGHSNGGGMAMRLACDVPGMVRGIAVVATKVLSRYPCERGGPVPAIFFHGTEDPISPHAGRPDGRIPGSRIWLGRTLSSDETLALYARRNRCRGVGEAQVRDAVDDGTRAVITRWRGCAAPLALVVLEGGGHGWPGARRGAGRREGPTSQELDAGETAMRFLLAAE